LTNILQNTCIQKYSFLQNCSFSQEMCFCFTGAKKIRIAAIIKWRANKVEIIDSYGEHRIEDIPNRENVKYNVCQSFLFETNLKITNICEYFLQFVTPLTNKKKASNSAHTDGFRMIFWTNIHKSTTCSLSNYYFQTCKKCLSITSCVDKFRTGVLAAEKRRLCPQKYALFCWLEFARE